MPVGDYSDQQKAEVLVVLKSNQGNVSRTARETDVPGSTIRDWRDGVGTRALTAEIRAQKSKEMADRLSWIAERILDSVSDADIASATLLQRMTTFGILVDKMRLIQGEATEITESRQGSEDIRKRIMAKLMAAESRTLAESETLELED